MTLTTEDIQLIKQALKPDFDKIDERFEHVDKQFEQVHKKFDQKFERLDERLDTIVQEIIKTQGEFHEEHEERITRIEKELHIA